MKVAIGLRGEPAVVGLIHHYVVRSDKTQSLEGEPPNGMVVIAFDSVEKLREWYDSPAYAAIRPIRQRAAKSRIFIVEGLAPQQKIAGRSEPLEKLRQRLSLLIVGVNVHRWNEQASGASE